MPMRSPPTCGILAANPLDIEALIVAGELTLRMGDSTAAAAFFGRAEKLDPINPRIKAGWGSLMVRAERPGMALRAVSGGRAARAEPAASSPPIAGSPMI